MKTTKRTTFVMSLAAIAIACPLITTATCDPVFGTFEFFRDDDDFFFDDGIYYEDVFFDDVYYDDCFFDCWW